MNRRDFLSFLSGDRASHESLVSPGKDRKITAGLESYAQPLDLQAAYHLLRRATFAPTYAMAVQLVGKTASEAVEMVLGDGNDTAPSSPGGWVDVSTENPNAADIYTKLKIEGDWKGYFDQLQQWWIGLMQSETFPTREKLTLFWSGHFTSEFTIDENYILPQLLYRQNQLIRSMRLGNLKDFAEEITLNGAMLMYLGGELNTVGKPNENYARELMELFTVGIGWYTEGDVKEAARILTGWRIAKFSDEPALNGIYTTYFEPLSHDTGAKQYLGVSIPARTADNNTATLVRKEEIRKLLDILFEVRADALAHFIATKVYHFFVYSNPGGDDSGVINDLADLFKQNAFQIRPIIAALLKSAHFYDEANRGVQIKTPAEFVVGLGRQLPSALSGPGSVLASVEQTLMDPPNVAGWEGYHTWINTKTFPLRTQFARNLINGWSSSAAVAFVKQFPDFSDADLLTAHLEEYFLPKSVSATRHQNYVNVLLQNAPIYEWNNIITTDEAGAGTRIKALLNAFIKAPDFQLC